MYHSFKNFLEKKYKNQKTINGYIRDIEDFTEFVEKEGIGLAKIKETNIKQYNLNLNEKGYSNHTIARKNSSLRLYLKYLRKQGVMTINPMEDIKQPRLNKKEVSFSNEDIESLENMIKSKRDHLLFCLSYYDKVKISEIVRIKKEQYEKNQGVLYLEKRAVIIHSKTKELLDEYIEHTNNSEYLLTNQHDKPLSESGVYFILKRYFEEIGKPEIRPVDLYKRNTQS